MNAQVDLSSLARLPPTPPVEDRWAELELRSPSPAWWRGIIDSCISPKAPVGLCALLATGSHFCRASRAEAIVAWASEIPGFTYRGRASILYRTHVAPPRAKTSA